MQTALVNATSAETVRIHRQTRPPAQTRWTDAWAAPDAPEPLQNLLVSHAHNRLHAADDPAVVSMPVGQLVGRMNRVRPVAG